MNSFPRLNFPPVEFRIRRSGAVRQIWDNIRRQWLVLTPEEWVRQHLIRCLTDYRGVVPQQIAQEHPVGLNGMNQRADVVVYGHDGRIALLAECKAPTVELCGKVLDQAVRYNSKLGARYVVLTNGLVHYCYTFDSHTGQYAPLDHFPDINQGY